MTAPGKLRDLVVFNVQADAFASLPFQVLAEVVTYKENASVKAAIPQMAGLRPLTINGALPVFLMSKKTPR